MRGRGDRLQFGDALDDAEHGNLGVAERDKSGVDAVGAGVRHEIPWFPKGRCWQGDYGPHINRLGRPSGEVNFVFDRMLGTIRLPASWADVVDARAGFR